MSFQDVRISRTDLCGAVCFATASVHEATVGGGDGGGGGFGGAATVQVGRFWRLPVGHGAIAPARRRAGSVSGGRGGVWDTGDEGRSEGTGWGWTTYPCVASRASPPSLSDGKAVVYLPARVERAPEATNRNEFSSAVGGGL